MNLEPAFLSSLVQFLSGFAVIFLVVLWVSLILWTSRDIRRRTRDTFLRVLAIILSTILFVPGVLVYLLVRPPLTLEEEYQKNLEEEALLQTLEETLQCPGCSRKVDKDWSVCPSCHTRLKKKCVSCGKLLEINWDLCPYCETPASGYHRRQTSMENLITQSVSNQNTLTNKEE